jgi:2-polyprenyl-3-methyl-5-hydroxy-6-metoxy-1,4-benzoquinol methylase
MAEHVCPYLAGYFLANRLRKLLHSPHRILAPYVRPGMVVLDVGSAMGFFSLPLARMVGPEGRVVCVDVQPKMLDVLRRRAARAGLAGRIETHVSTENSIGLHGWDNRFDFALAFTMLHEVGDPANFLREIHQMLKPGAPLLLAEPTGHVSPFDFEHTVAHAREEGFMVASHPRVRLTYAVLLTKPQPIVYTPFLGALG